MTCQIDNKRMCVLKQIILIFFLEIRSNQKHGEKIARTYTEKKLEIITGCTINCMKSLPDQNQIYWKKVYILRTTTIYVFSEQIYLDRKNIREESFLRATKQICVRCYCSPSTLERVDYCLSCGLYLSPAK